MIVLFQITLILIFVLSSLNGFRFSQSAFFLRKEIISKYSLRDRASVDIDTWQTNDKIFDTNEDNNLHYNSRDIPMGIDRDRRFSMSSNQELEITFLGTASCNPSFSRSANSIALKYLSDIWIFDCGESCQLQIQRSILRPSKIRKIFLTHTHGDHSFGLPGLLCMIGKSTEDEGDPRNGTTQSIVDIYGPKGVYDYVRTSLALTYSRGLPKIRVFELMSVPYVYNNQLKMRSTPFFSECQFSCRNIDVELAGQIYPNSDGSYNVTKGDALTVQAAPMKHCVPCVGYVITEKPRIGKLRIDYLKPIVESNLQALTKLPGLEKDPKKIYAILKNMKPNECYKLPDGQIIRQKDVSEPIIHGRKVVIMGDTCSGEFMAPLAKNCSVLVHEATNSFVHTIDRIRFKSAEQHEQATISHGHSTPQMAGRFAKQIGAKMMLLTHFSPRYQGDSSEESMSLMWKIEDLAKSQFQCGGRDDVIAAWDLMTISVQRSTSETD